MDIDEIVRKYKNRTGICRYYVWETEKRQTHLVLEIAWRGKALFTIPIKFWRHTY